MDGGVENVFQSVVDRSSGCCEAMVRLPHGVWTRCGKRPIQIHHALKRSRGGKLLDEVGETYHLVAVCPRHHRHAETSGEHTGLLIDGWVISGPDGPSYMGSDPVLRARYP